jgi:hypothetical protein
LLVLHVFKCARQVSLLVVLNTLVKTQVLLVAACVFGSTSQCNS